ncbi:MAG TPA: cupin domain-containing protein [Gaiellaceae bacterium]|jgi:quercetin dioxygenase-like cupin family protein
MPPPGFEVRAVSVEPGSDRIYHRDEWRDALVVVVQGEIELDCRDGKRQRLAHGDVLWLTGLPVRAIRNRRSEPALLVAIARGARPGETPRA